MIAPARLIEKVTPLIFDGEMNSLACWNFYSVYVAAVGES
jgi:hypothetical protein